MQRLYEVGYDVEVGCPLCGAASDTLFHRLFECEATAALREESLPMGALDAILSGAKAPHLLMGFQLMPPRIRPLSSGLGHEHYETWSHSGEPAEHLLVGEVFTDGSCYKEGPPTWHRAGWSVVKVAYDGTMTAWMRGAVGDQLPQTSPASEYVAGLAAATAKGEGVTVANCDYKGIEALE